jgi:hypothetical protein
MPAILALVLIAVLAVVALAVLSIFVHVLFSPWVLIAAIAIFAWFKLRPGRARQ